MRHKINKIFLVGIVIISMLFGGILIYTLHNVEKKMVSVRDLEGGEMYVRNLSCHKEKKRRTVDDGEFYNKVIKLCAKAVTYRQLTSVDTGWKESTTHIEPSISLIKNSNQYIISLFEAQKQLSRDFIYRDEPLISIEKINLAGSDAGTEWSYFCKLKPDEYVTLFELLQRYTGGETIK